jgi:hypothetical protein
MFDIRLEEVQDQMAAKVMVKKNLRIFKALFHQYSNSGPRNDNHKTFDALSSQTRLITAAEIIKLLKDYGM